jgi:DNA-binding transcriptional MerR regulator
MTKSEVAQLKKLYYSIGEVAQMFHVNTSLLRFWEKEFKFDIAKKNQKGNRLYSVKEIEKIRQIYQWVKVEGYTLEGAKHRLGSAVKNKTTTAQSSEVSDVINRLESLKQRLIALKTL